MFLLVLAALIFVPALASNAATFTKPEDILRVKTVASPRISPDGTRILYTVREADLENNRFFTSLWMTGWDGQKPAKLIDRSSISSIRWAPDGKRAAVVMTKDGETDPLVSSRRLAPPRR